MFSHKMNKAGELSLIGELTIQNITAVKDALLKAINNASAVNLNLEGVTDVDVAFLQLLRSAQKSCEIRKKPLTLQNVPGLFHEKAEESGFAESYGTDLSER
ncbi:MAG: STAS domain-containing protein [Nitrospirae bacterium YQR-1]